MTLSEPVQPTFRVPGLIVATHAEGPTTVITLQGEADSATLPALLDLVVHAVTERDGPVVLDLDQTDFIDTATARAIGRAASALQDRSRQLTIRSPSRLATVVLSFTGLSHLIEDHHSEGLQS